MTGAQAFKRMHGIQESLAGRVAILNLSSLSQNEIYNHCTSQPFRLNLQELKEKQATAKSADLMQMFSRIWTDVYKRQELYHSQQSNATAVGS